MNNYLHKGLTIIALALLLASCSETTTVTQNTKPISSAQSDIDKGIIAAKSKSYKKAINFFATSIDKNTVCAVFPNNLKLFIVILIALTK